MKDSLRILEEQGFEVENTLMLCLGDENQYLSFLEKALRDPAFEELGQALAEKDARRGFELAHRLKGSLSNMGIVPLYEELFNMVESLRLNIVDGLDEDYQNLMSKREELKELVSKL